MRALSTVLLVAVALLTNAKQPTGRHNTFIEGELTKYNLDDYIILAPVAIPDTVVNYQQLVPDDLKQLLIDHVDQASKAFQGLPDTEKARLAVKLPTPVHSSQIKPYSNGNVKRSAGKNEIDLDATAALYKQALEFLDKYDVELRMQ
ncbi:Protein CBG13192 [Caenorhabditis briggsae]|uniref:Protein CBG13192 n=2 Tax=Caenorhabditis briggsae TaxID=6238 RepID=A8XH95_CAEBR|nr:Protein CBG13192 [Caenorhabditis briggsae]ULU00223.1 hypothetical protein L3Y34_001027 [Caenorhabditis briggsae]CAP32019.1 Protein CBG13192 [Caenorhabditis briggsae]